VLRASPRPVSVLGFGQDQVDFHLVRGSVDRLLVKVHRNMAMVALDQVGFPSTRDPELAANS
jgi:hypothetical protein